MILVDTALAKREAAGRPIRVGMVGAGFMGRGVALQILRYTRGMRLVAIANRTLERARRAYTEAGIEADAVVGANTQSHLDQAIGEGKPVVTASWELVCRSGLVDVVLEVTGAVEFGARAVTEAIAHGKHVVTMNAELIGTVGAVLQARAAAAGVVLSLADGDQPGVTMNLYRFVRGLGLRPALCGNIKGLHDPYRNPETQAGFAARWGQNAHMVTSAADGTKVSFEQAVVANATGMRVLRRGMLGPTVAAGTPVREAARSFPVDELLRGPGVVDYVVGAEPAPGVFLLATCDHPTQRHYLNLYKLGEGPLYCFYTPYHLCHFEVPNTIARAALFGDAALDRAGPPQVDVVAAAKVSLPVGTVLDGLGGFTTYGLCENAAEARAGRLLPIGLAEGCRLTRAVDRDSVLTEGDVDRPAGRLTDRLRAEQDAFLAESSG